MTPTLRKYHRMVWFSFALILPMLFIAAVLSIPKSQTNPRPVIDQPEAMARILKTVHANHGIVRIRTNAVNTKTQLEVIIQKPLNVPEALVRYECDATAPLLLGKLGPVGVYRFSLGEQIGSHPCTVKFINPFNQIVFDQISI